MDAKTQMTLEDHLKQIITAVDVARECWWDARDPALGSEDRYRGWLKVRTQLRCIDKNAAAALELLPPFLLL